MSITPATRISITANRGVTGALFGLAILSAVIRTYIRAIKLKQFAIEDGLVLFAVTVLCAVTVLYYLTLNNMYNLLDLILLGMGDQLPLDVIMSIPKESKEANALAFLNWLVLFPVKFAYLFFFRKLVLRMGKIKTWWWCVTVFMVPAAIACFTVSQIACPHTGVVEVIERCSGPSSNTRQVRVTSVTTAFDVVTDFMVASLPIMLLWKVQISIHQKLGLGIMLSLSLVMAIVAIVRLAGIRLGGGEVDIVWVSFWQQQECSIAVCMLSVTAFRSFFVANSTPNRARIVSAYWKNKLLRRKALDESSEKGVDDLPTIPSATLTGVRTMIRGSGSLGTDSCDDRQMMLHV